MATKEQFGHCISILIQKRVIVCDTVQNNTEPGPTVFYLPSDKAETIPLDNELEKVIYIEAN